MRALLLLFPTHPGKVFAGDGVLGKLDPASHDVVLSFC